MLRIHKYITIVCVFLTQHFVAALAVEKNSNPHMILRARASHSVLGALKNETLLLQKFTTSLKTINSTYPRPLPRMLMIQSSINGVTSSCREEIVECSKSVSNITEAKAVVQYLVKVTEPTLKSTMSLLKSKKAVIPEFVFGLGDVSSVIPTLLSNLRTCKLSLDKCLQGWIPSGSEAYRPAAKAVGSQISQDIYDAIYYFGDSSITTVRPDPTRKPPNPTGCPEPPCVFPD